MYLNPEKMAGGVYSYRLGWKFTDCQKQSVFEKHELPWCFFYENTA